MTTSSSWLGVEIRHLIAVAAVARAGSFRGAADDLGYVQSAVSQHVAQLERLVGHRLVERSRGARGVQLTRKGQILIAHVDDIVARLRAAQADVAAVKRPVLRVGYSVALAPQLLGPLTRRLAAGGIRLLGTEGGSDASLANDIECGRLDAAFVGSRLSSNRFTNEELGDDQWVLLTRSGSQAQPPTSLRDLVRYPWVVLDGCTSQRSALDALRGCGSPPRIAARAGCEGTIRAFVRAGLGIAVVPRLAVHPDDAGVVAVPFEGVLPPPPLALSWLRGRRELRALRRLYRVSAELLRDVGVADRPSATIAA